MGQKVAAIGELNSFWLICYFNRLMYGTSIFQQVNLSLLSQWRSVRQLTHNRDIIGTARDRFQPDKVILSSFKIHTF